jgi:hypothetical protein
VAACARTGRTHDPHVPELPCPIRAARRDSVDSLETSADAIRRAASTPGAGLGLTQLDNCWRRHAVREETSPRAAVPTRPVRGCSRPSPARRSVRSASARADRHGAPHLGSERAYSSPRSHAPGVDDADVIRDQQTCVLSTRLALAGPGSPRTGARVGVWLT